MGELSMSRKEPEEFLAGTHVGIVCVAEEDGRAPLAIPIWYRYEPGGEVHASTDNVLVKIRPERSGSADFAKLGLG